MKKYLFFNWKMNPSSVQEAKNIFQVYQKEENLTLNNLNNIIAVPFVYLDALNLLKQASKSKIILAGQDSFWLNRGAYTGEISPSMIKNLGAEYVIIGHSERREYFNENETMINKKIKAVLNSGLKVVLCVGEKERKKQELTSCFRIKKIIFDQLNYALQGVNIKKKESLIIAYEPLWAIGSGITEDLKKTEEVIILIREWLKRRFSGEIAKTFPVIYGGSVNSSNLLDYLKSKNINGVLIGGASIQKKEIVNIFSKIKSM